LGKNKKPNQDGKNRQKAHNGKNKPEPTPPPPTDWKGVSHLYKVALAITVPIAISHILSGLPASDQLAGLKYVCDTFKQTFSNSGLLIGIIIFEGVLIILLAIALGLFYWFNMKERDTKNARIEKLVQAESRAASNMTLPDELPDEFKEEFRRLLTKKEI